MKSLKKSYLPTAFLFATLVGQVHGEDAFCYVDDPCSNFYADCCCNDGRFFVRADALFWRADQVGIRNLAALGESSGTSNSFSNAPSRSSSTGLTKNNKFIFDWRGGYRVGLGYDFACDWALQADWTYYHGHAHVNSTLGIVQARAEWHLNYNVVDLIFATPDYYASSCLSWKVFGGLRGASIIETLEPHLGSFSTGNSFSNNVFFGVSRGSSTNDLSYRSSFYGIGPELGYDVNYALGCDFSVFGKATGAIVFGHTLNKRVTSSSSSSSFTQADSTTSSSFSSSMTFITSDEFLCEPVIDLELGIAWQKCFCSMDLLLKLAVEHHQWFNHDQIGSTSFLGAGGGDLFFDGATFSIEIGF